MSVELLKQKRTRGNRGNSLEERVSALENYIALLLKTSDIADSAITNPKIADTAVDSLKLANSAVTAAKTAVAAIDSSTGNITANHIVASMIQAGAIIAEKIAAGAVTAAKINVSQLSAISADIGTITAGSITGITITGGTIQTGTSGQRVVLSGSTIKYYDSNGVKRIESFGGQGTVSYFNSSGTLMGGIEGNQGSANYGLRFIVVTSPYDAKVSLGLYDTYSELDSHLYPYTNDSCDLGSFSARWRHLYLYQNIYSSIGSIYLAVGKAIYFGTSNSIIGNTNDFTFNKAIICTSGSIDQTDTSGRVRQYLAGFRARTEPPAPASGECYIYFNSADNKLYAKIGTTSYLLAG